MGDLVDWVGSVLVSIGRWYTRVSLLVLWKTDAFER